LKFRYGLGVQVSFYCTEVANQAMLFCGSLELHLRFYHFPRWKPSRTFPSARCWVEVRIFYDSTDFHLSKINSVNSQGPLFW